MNAHKPARGEWTAPVVDGWSHGSIPVAPDGLLPEARDTWTVWFTAWFAANWGPEDLPGLRMLIRLYNCTLLPEVSAAERSELRQLMDSYGISKKGQQDRRWVKPKKDEAAAPAATPTKAKASRYAHLRAV